MKTIQDLKTKVFESLGTVSMCWSETPKGVFDDTLALKIGNELWQAIEDHMLVSPPNPEVRQEFNPLEIFRLDVDSNSIIKRYREKLGLETPNNRIDTGDLKCIFLALNNMGYSVSKVVNRDKEQ